MPQIKEEGVPYKSLLKPRRELPDTLSRRIRVALKISQTELAEMLGCSTKTVGEWETGKRVPMGVFQAGLERIARTNKVK